MKRTGMTLDRLMRESSDCVQSALRSEDRAQQLVASRIVETPVVFERWEAEHVTLMRGVAEYSALRSQVTALKHTTLGLVHAKAMFEYLRNKQVRGARRSTLVRHFYPNRGYTSGMVAAHGSYLRKTCSFLCTSHVGTGAVQDESFIDPIQYYESLYAEYFDLYCRVHISTEVDSASEAALLPLLKHQLNEWRWAILNPREGVSRIRRESTIRHATGDTQRLRTLTIKGREPL